MATNFLKFCMADSVDGVAFVVGVLGVDCAVGKAVCALAGDYFCVWQWHWDPNLWGFIEG